MIWFLAQYSSPYSPEYIKRLETKADSYETLFYFLILVCIFLFAGIVYQYLKIRKLKFVQPRDNRSKKFYPDSKPSRKTRSANPPSSQKQPEKSHSSQVISSGEGFPTQKDLPDPGLIYKYSVHGDSPEKIITIGQKEGTIKTFSTEIMDHHLTIMIRPINNSSNHDIYNLPDLIEEEYVIDFRRGAKVIYNMPDSGKIEEMGARMRIYIKKTPDPAGDPSFSDIEPGQPIRFRLGDRLTQEGKFRQGYFEFHFYTKPFETTTKSGIKCIEKNFFLKLYKIYPGYDTASQNEEGLFAMIDPFAKR